MSIVKEKYDKLLNLLNNDTLAWAKHSGVPFIICSFDRKVCGSINKMVSELQVSLMNYNIRVINIEELIYSILQTEELLEPAITAEKENSFDVTGIQNKNISVMLDEYDDSALRALMV